MTHDLFHHEIAAASLLATLAVALLLATACARRVVRADPPRATPLAVELNRATLDVLTALPGIGRRSAVALLKGRPYRTLDEVAQVVGARRARALAPYVTFDPR